MHRGEELAWAAGFFDAEGCSSNPTYPMISISQADPEPLDRLRSATGSLSIRGPFRNSGLGRKPMWRAYAYAWKALAVLSGLAPYLSEPKRSQALIAFINYPIESTFDRDYWDHAHPRARESLAWVAGFVEGDGCFSYSPSNGTAVVSILQDELQPLERVRFVLGSGTIYGPYDRPRSSLGTRPYWNFRAAGLERVQAIAAMLWPWLGPAKRAQADRVLHEVRLRNATCVRGHRKEPGKPACPACVREHWRMYREGTLFEPALPYLAGQVPDLVRFGVKNVARFVVSP